LKTSCDEYYISKLKIGAKKKIVIAAEIAKIIMLIPSHCQIRTAKKYFILEVIKLGDFKRRFISAYPNSIGFFALNPKGYKVIIIEYTNFEIMKIKIMSSILKYNHS